METPTARKERNSYKYEIQSKGTYIKKYPCIQFPTQK